MEHENSILADSNSDKLLKQDLENDPQELALQTNFTVDEILALKRTFARVSESIEANGQITKEEFCLALFKTRKSNIFCDRVFEMFDKKRTGMIDFQEFVHAMSVFSHRTPLDQKARFAFSLYDIDQTGLIRPNEVKAFLLELFRDMRNNIEVLESVIDQIVKNTFKVVDSDHSGTIDLQEWIALVHQRPAVINYMTLPKLLEMAQENEMEIPYGEIVRC